VLRDPDDLAARGAMQIGAHQTGWNQAAVAGLYRELSVVDLPDRRACLAGCGNSAPRGRHCPLWPGKPRRNGPDGSIRDHSKPRARSRSMSPPIDFGFAGDRLAAVPPIIGERRA
jgi:hypothetical protein